MEGGKKVLNVKIELIENLPKNERMLLEILYVHRRSIIVKGLKGYVLWMQSAKCSQFIEILFERC